VGAISGRDRRSFESCREWGIEMAFWDRLSWRRARDKDLEEEIQSHLRMAMQERARLGESADESAATARAEFGNVGLVKEVTREMWGWMSIERLVQDVRYAARVLRRSPGFAAVAILSMGLGIGANTAIFSLVDALLLRSLPVRNASELMTVGDPARTGGVSEGAGRTDLFSHPFYERFRERNSVFRDVYATGRSEKLNVMVSGAAEVSHVRARFVTGNFFGMLGVRALIGRTFTEEEVRREGGAPVIVISYGYWERQFGLDPAVVGRMITINGSSFTVIGVTPREFSGDVVGVPNDMWFPITMQAAANPGRNYLRDRKMSWLLLMGRRKAGVSERQAEAGVQVTGTQIFRELYKGDETPEELAGLLRGRIPVSPGAKGFSRMRHDAALPLTILMGIVGVILLMCCANVANLQLARALNRGREMGLRLAVGAGPGRLIRQLLTESVALACAGGTVGLLFAFWGSHLLLRLMTPEGPLPLHTEPNAPVLYFTAAIAIFSGLLFGLAPALRTIHFDLVSSLKESRAGQQPDGFSRSFGKMLVVSQIVFSMILLVFAGLFLGTLKNLRSVDVGYQREGLLLVQVDPKTGGYKDAQMNSMSMELLSRLQRIPGVAAATFSENGLFSGTYSEGTVEVEGDKPRSRDEKQVGNDRVGPNYFEVVGTRVIEGRGIGMEDNKDTPRVAVINKKMARFYFPHSSAVGRHLFEGEGKDRVTLTIVGVVEDAKEQDLRKVTPRRFYFASLQKTEPVSFVNYEIRTRAASAPVAEGVRRTVASSNSRLPVTSMESADELINDELSAERLLARLSGFFGLLALLLGAIGLYGVMAYMTTRRTAEIGIRLALGAERGKVIQMVVGETWRLVAIGLAIGVLVSTAMARVFEKSLFGVSAFDPATTLWAVAAISLAALIAAYLPARKAARVDPLIALHYE